MEIVLIILLLIIFTFILMKIINYSFLYIFIFKKKPEIWILFMFLLSFISFFIAHLFSLKFYNLFWPILLVSYFQFIKPVSEINLIDNIKYSKSTYNEIGKKNGWLKKVTGNFMFVLGACLGYYMFYY